MAIPLDYRTSVSDTRRTEFLAETAGSLVSAEASLSAGQQLCVSFAKEMFPTAVSALFVRSVGKEKVDRLREKVSQLGAALNGEHKVSGRFFPLGSRTYKCYLTLARDVRVIFFAATFVESK